ncbi:MAG: glycosyltransferase family A protein [Verrucomicrobiota bacterium]|jgi:glycosyltransferase involved in cell wall biosynthesis|nr:glycosyltransferase family A protein [Verrucomicrobiota bacterium]MDP7050723.1 glycosyltransferase family A protein [Verrucomicrobiota bacterium]
MSEHVRIISVIPVYNGERFIRATLDSLAAQTLGPDRVVILDDASTDDTAKLVEAYELLDCELIRGEQNEGLFRNFNKALDYATGCDYLHYICADDVLLPEFMERMTDALANAIAPSFSYCLPEFIDKDGNQLESPEPKQTQPRAVSANALLAQHSECDSLMLGGVIIKTLGQACPVQFRTDMPHAADCIFYSDLTQACERRIVVPEVLLQVRRHPFSMTKRNEENIQSWVHDEWEAIQHAFGLMELAVLPRWLRRQKLRCMFAARSRVKMQQMAGEKPEHARRIFESARPRVPWLHWQLGTITVFLRDLFFGSSLNKEQWQ